MRRIFPGIDGYVGYISKAALSLLPSKFHTWRPLMAHSSQKHIKQKILVTVVEPTQVDTLQGHQSL